MVFPDSDREMVSLLSLGEATQRIPRRTPGLLSTAPPALELAPWSLLVDRHFPFAPRADLQRRRGSFFRN